MSPEQECDDDFMSLVSAQREILRRLNKEKSARSGECNELKLAMKAGESNSNLNSTLMKHGQFTDNSAPFGLMNEPIIEQRLVRDGLGHKNSNRRISGGFDVDTTCDSLTWTNFSDYRRKHKISKMAYKKNFRTDGLSIKKMGSARHSRLRGMLANALAFGVDPTTVRTSGIIDPHNPKEQKSDVCLNIPRQVSTRVERLDLNIDIATLRSEFENFVRAMEKSMKSQQDIHDWDRRMGLKRSHSKTMRLSMRSRNKLRKAINV